MDSLLVKPTPTQMHRNPNVAVVGAGVIGLSTAIVLARAGCEVAVFAGRRRRGIASAVAAASWYPYAVSGFRREWAAATYRWLAALAEEAPASGARRQEAVEFVDAPDEADATRYVEDLWWRDLPGTDVRRVDLPLAERTFDFGADDPLGQRTFAAAVEFKTIVVKMDAYLPFLETMLADVGGRIVPETWIGDLRQLGRRRHCDAVVNCAGFAAEMFADGSRAGGVRPVAGQVLRVAAPGVRRLTVIHSGAFHEEPLYVVPRGDLLEGGPGEVVLGGSYVPTSADSPQCEAPPADERLTARIVRRCQAVEPRLAGMRVLETRVGLRPVAGAVQVGRDPGNALRGDEPSVFHNYGHGGGGVSLSWGCAEAIAAEVLQSVGLGAGR
ncbi:MAG: FAD-binding oxidoreductase [Pirellulales bacterium]|nr:FAD-binding oxidoreductase [Pirellulales bacterium]